MDLKIRWLSLQDTEESVQPLLPVHMNSAGLGGLKISLCIRHLPSIQYACVLVNSKCFNFCADSILAPRGADGRIVGMFSQAFLAVLLCAAVVPLYAQNDEGTSCAGKKTLFLNVLQFFLYAFSFCHAF